MHFREYIIQLKVWLYNKLANAHLIKDQRPVDYYVSKISDDAPWVYSSYIASVFYHLEEENYMNSHQNRREAVEMVRIWNEMGYNVYVQDANTPRNLPSLKNVQIVFGHEPQMPLAAKKYKAPIRIYYATGTYRDHNNRMVKQMTDWVNRRYAAHIPYERMQASHNSYDIATHVLMIGSQFTKETVPLAYRSKITLIHQSLQPTKILSPVTYASENEFFYMGSSGNMLRGVPLLFEYFITHSKLRLHVVGPIKDNYYQLMKARLTPNIVLHGFMDINSDAFMQIISHCNFMLYPSGSEGVPGSVLNGMKNGLIPIVTPWASFDEIEKYGYMLSDWSINAIDEAVRWALAIPSSQVDQMKKNCQKYVLTNFSLERFCSEFSNFFNQFLQ